MSEHVNLETHKAQIRQHIEESRKLRESYMELMAQTQFLEQMVDNLEKEVRNFDKNNRFIFWCSVVFAGIIGMAIGASI